jgi:hypothetical protein
LPKDRNFASAKIKLALQLSGSALRPSPFAHLYHPVGNRNRSNLGVGVPVAQPPGCKRITRFVKQLKRSIQGAVLKQNGIRASPI